MSKVTISDLYYQLYFWLAVLSLGLLYFIVLKVCFGVRDVWSEVLCCQWVSNIQESNLPSAPKPQTYADQDAARVDSDEDEDYDEEEEDVE